MQIVANGIGIEIDDQGLPGGEPLLLIMGLGMQLIAWPDELVQGLVSHGFRVIRMDNRDAGLSQGFEQAAKPRLALQAMRYTMHLRVNSPYTIADMAADALGVLDALGLQRAHVCGASMGGMIAQHLAAQHAERVRSLTLMMTTTGARRLPQPTLRARQVLLSRPASAATADVVAHLERLMAVIGSPGWPPDRERQRQRLEASVKRAWRPQGTARQMLAVMADGDRSALMPLISAPTRIIHGADDPLVRVAAGHDLVQRIRGAVADIVPGMGHDLPQALLPRFVQGIVENAAR